MPHLQGYYRMTFAIPPERRDSILADAIWWFHGFQAANKGSDGTDPTRDLGVQLTAVRADINRLGDGRSRLIGSDDRNLAIAIREAEFEAIFDAFRESADAEDVKTGFDTLKRILAEFSAERKAARQWAGYPF